MKYPLRDPSEIDLASNFWKMEPRDLYGRWASSRGSRLGRLKESVSAKVHLAAAAVASKAVPEAHRELEPAEARQALDMKHEEREALINAAGLHSSLPDATTDLLHRWAETSDPDEKDKIREELHIRQKALNSALKVISEGDKRAKHDQTRDYWRTLDDHFQSSTVGRALLKIRDRFTREESFEAREKTAEKGKETAKEFFTHLATGRMVGVIVSAAAGLATHVLGSEEIPEVIRSFAENPAVEAGLAVAAGVALALGVKAVKKLGKKAAVRAAQKVQLKEAEKHVF